jgi:diketogulonate reductase-like aldo/keto reductase
MYNLTYLYFVVISSEYFIANPFLALGFQNLANRSLVDDTLRKVNGLKPIAAELGVSLAQLSIAWCASNPNVSSVITGATKESQVHFPNSCSSEDHYCSKQACLHGKEYSDPFGKPHEQIVENMKALDVIPLLTPEVLDRIEAVVQSKPKRTESYR